MLPRENRMVDAEDFLATIKGGVKSANRFFVLTIAASASANKTVESEAAILYPDGDGQPPAVKVGFIVAKRQLPHAVDRNRAKRQLRHLIYTRLDELNDALPGAHIVIRVLAASKGQSSETLGNYLDKALSKALSRLTETQSVEKESTLKELATEGAVVD